MHAVSLALVFLAPSALAVAAAPDEQALQNAHLATAGPGLLDYFRKRTPPGPDSTVIADLIKKLGDPTPAMRDQSTGGLICFGPFAVPLLRQAVNGIDDPDLAARAAACLQQIE